VKELDDLVFEFKEIGRRNRKAPRGFIAHQIMTLLHEFPRLAPGTSQQTLLEIAAKEREWRRW
jgi:hypothetical protein